MSRTPRRKSADAYHHGDLRRALVVGALRAIEREGLEALSLRAVGRDLGVSPRAPYRHFATKEELLAAVAVEGFRMSAAFMRERLAGVPDEPVAQLGAIVRAYVVFAVKHPAAFRVMYAPYDTVSEGAPELVRVRAEGHAEIMKRIALGQESGAIRPGDPMHIALGMAAMMHGLAVLLVQGQLGRYERPVDAERLAAVVAGLLFEGLLRREAAETRGARSSSAKG